jgi:hypothetical protein
MTVWLLFNRYDDTIEGVYTAAGKLQREKELLEEARQRMATANSRLTAEIVELRNLRQPYIIEAEQLLGAEAEAKEANNSGALKNIRKQRRVMLKQAEHLTYDIKKREDKILASQRMLTEELLYTYGKPYRWEEFQITEK